MLLCGCGHQHQIKRDGRGADAPAGAPESGPSERGARSLQPRPGSGPAEDRDRRVAGTWDFKWTPGTEIRIAIQELPDGESHVSLDDAVAELKAALESWVPEQGAGPHLSWKIVDERMPAPKASYWARSDVEILRRKRPVQYDVLVSFAQLPVTIEATSERPLSEVNYPRCELGSYARRVEYGVPTLYLGPHQGFQGTKEDEPLAGEAAARAWRSSPEGIFTLVHELGHLFGLAHEQQNPRFQGELDWLPMETRIDIAELRNQPTPPPGANVGDEAAVRDALRIFIKSEIEDRWVGDLRFSDWRKPPQVEDGKVDFKSVMAKPVYQCFLKGGHGRDYDCSKRRICEVEQKEFEALSRPTDSDREHLKVLYGERPQGGSQK